MQCDSHARAMLFLNQLDGLPKYVQLGTSGSFEGHELGCDGRLSQVSFTSAPMIEGCRLPQARRPFDNPEVDIFRKKNHVVVSLGGDGGERNLEFRWQGGLIVTLSYLEEDGPALGVEEVDPDGSLTRRVIFLDGRRHPLRYHRGPFPETAGKKVPSGHPRGVAGAPRLVSASPTISSLGAPYSG